MLVRRVATSAAPGRDPDYSDAFEIHLPKPDTRSAEQWARASLDQAPKVLRRVIVLAHRGILRFRLGPLTSPELVLGWRIRSCDHDEIELETDGPLMRGVIVGRRTSPTATRIESRLYFHRRLLGRAIWWLVGPLHRWIAPKLLQRAASAQGLSSASASG